MVDSVDRIDSIGPLRPEPSICVESIFVTSYLGRNSEKIFELAEFIDVIRRKDCC